MRLARLGRTVGLTCLVHLAAPLPCHASPYCDDLKRRDRSVMKDAHAARLIAQAVDAEDFYFVELGRNLYAVRAKDDECERDRRCRISFLRVKDKSAEEAFSIVGSGKLQGSTALGQIGRHIFHQVEFELYAERSIMFNISTDGEKILLHPSDTRSDGKAACYR